MITRIKKEMTKQRTLKVKIQCNLLAVTLLLALPFIYQPLITKAIGAVSEAMEKEVTVYNYVVRDVPVARNVEDDYSLDTDGDMVTPSEMIEYTWEEPAIALAIAKAESGLDPEKPSEVDITKDGKAFSYGLFQINLTVHDIEGYYCPDAFSGRNNYAVIVDEELYNTCVELAKDTEINIKKAKEIYDSRGWNAWGAYTNLSYLKHVSH